MKKILFLILLLSSLGAWAQEPVKYSEVIQCEGISADQAYSNIELWAVNSFKSPQKNVQLRDKEGKKLVIKAATVFKSQKKAVGDINGYIEYTLNIFFKDGRFKVDMIDICHKAKNPSYDFGYLYDVDTPDKKIAFASKKWLGEIYAEMKGTAYLEFKDICGMLEKAAKTQTTDDNW
jgi:hypothetical protein